jgi:hypothetical protein
MITEPRIGNSPRWDTPRVAEIAGIEPATLLAWRRNHHLLGGPRAGAQGKGQYWHNLIDVLVACAVAAVIRRGVEVDSAVVAEPDLRTMFAMMLDRPTTYTIFASHPRGRDPEVRPTFFYFDRENLIDEMFARSHGEVLILIDLRANMDRVRHAMQVTP